LFEYFSTTAVLEKIQSPCLKMSFNSLWNHVFVSTFFIFNINKMSYLFLNRINIIIIIIIVIIIIIIIILFQFFLTC